MKRYWLPAIVFFGYLLAGVAIAYGQTKIVKPFALKVDGILFATADPSLHTVTINTTEDIWLCAEKEDHSKTCRTVHTVNDWLFLNGETGQ